ncbi:gamma-glutamyltransferase family protein [Salicibibacter halophilus]|uniref:Gamma-glutamyltransferase family protein n=1 Tax=Salicibibacter halophilus TaxID=2502791 RepID=A0A514LMA7_9BACI|nr:gamma-glutamyltransferase family protein [Salicibibacter halophilus]QDI92976.1 gamma-glutamyltransferase family protein [Salicibibacter halophilus]
MSILDPLYQPYPHSRKSVFAENGMVATSQPLASQAGLDILKKGGNAIDAAIATAACLTVVEPTGNGIGGDAFALVWTKGKLHGLNASGPAPQSISIDALHEDGYEEIPETGWIPVTVPGAPSSWAALSEQFGKLPFTEVLQPAIDYAEHGFPVSPVVAHLWEQAYEDYQEDLVGPEFSGWFETFAPGNRIPKAGDVWASPDHAKTLRDIAQTKAASFYRGEIAEKIAQFSREHGGYLTKEDLAAYQPEWVKPIRVNYRGYDVWQLPPNGQGMIGLQALKMLNGFDFPARDTADTYHKQIEAMKLGFADGQTYITDPRYMDVSSESLLSDSYMDERRSLIGEAAREPEAGKPSDDGTIYLASADGEGNMVSFIQSNYMGFGSGLVVPGTGISLHNRGHDFSLDPTHINALQPGKKTYHTIIAGFLTKGHQAVGPFGVMGGLMQPQGHVQALMNTIDFDLNPQAALDAPRWRWVEDKTVSIEKTFPSHLAHALTNKGHDIEISSDTIGDFGRGQIIWRDSKTGILMGGSESRTDGTVSAY